MTTKLWAETNAKLLTQEEFKEQTGQDFSAFFEENKKECLAAWNELMIKHKKTFKKKGDCNCDEQNLKEPNGVLGKGTENEQPNRVWFCPVHKYTCSSLNRYKDLTPSPTE